MSPNIKKDDTQPNQLFKKVAELVELARKKVATTVNLTMVHTYFEIGKMIVEEEQEGKGRAKYGKSVLKDLSQSLSEKFGKGFSVDNLQNMRQFYMSFSIYETMSRKLKNHEININEEIPKFKLSWSHYLVLMKIENIEERNFYEIESSNNNWSLKELKRQYHSSLYERLALSRKKNDVLKLAIEGQKIEKSEDILKNPLSLEFLGLEEKSSYSETDLENAIISKLHNFLLELGKGFLFEARQKRFTFDDKHFFVDLVFYNRILQCYVLIDLKTDEVIHQDLGQMQMYVNYFDRYIKLEHENPSIGILLCKKKTDALIELTLPKNSNIYASEYRLYLPDKQLLQQKLNEWVIEFKDKKNIHQ